jgi:hypothetical protein
MQASRGVTHCLPLPLFSSGARHTALARDFLVTLGR